MTGQANGPRIAHLWEGVVIVVSILLAFGIDAWWGARQSRAAESEYLTQVRAELVQLRPELVSSIEIHAGLAERGTALLGDLDTVPADSVLLWSNRVFVVGLSTYFRTGLIGAAGPETVADADLRDLLARWPGAYADFKEEEDAMRQGRATTPPAGR